MSFSDYRIPGVFTRVFDATEFVVPNVTTILGMAGLASKGPFNVATEILNISDYARIFGPPDGNNLQSYYAAEAFFAHGNTLRFVRVGDGSQAKALLALAVSGGGSSPSIRAVSEGTWGHDLDVYVTTGSSGGATVRIEIRYFGASVEIYDNLSNGSDGAALIAAINGVSQYVEAVAGTAGGTIDDPQNGTLAGGDNGDTAPTASNFIGTTVNNTRTGLNIFRNRREYPLDIVICPDAYAEITVMDYLLDLAYERGDCFAITDSPDALDASGIVSWIGTLSGAGTDEDKTFGALYWPWVEMDSAQQINPVWTPTSGHIAGAYAYNDRVRWPWFAPAGPRRGILPTAIRTRMPLSDAEIEQVYADSQVNTLIHRNGVMINGKKTLYTNTTARMWVEVRRTLLTLRGFTERGARRVQFDPNDDHTFRELERNLQPVADFIKSERGARDLQFECSAALNPAAEKRQHRVHGRYYYKPTVAAETIIIDLLLTAEGLAFSERAVETV